MRKNNGGSSRWLLSTVKKAFRSRKKNKRRKPDKRSCTSEDLEQEEEQMRRRKRRWICGIPFTRKDQHSGTKSIINDTHVSEIVGYQKPTMVAQEENMQPKEVAITIAAAAEAAVTAPQAAMEFTSTRSCILHKEFLAAVTIQKFFRGYVVCVLSGSCHNLKISEMQLEIPFLEARIALKALKGVVKLQALIRGDNVRKRTALTLRKMQALLRLQTQLCDQRRRLFSLHECSLNNSSPLSDKVLMKWNYNIDSFGEDLDDDDAQKLRETIQCGSPISYPCAPRTPTKTFQEHNPKISLLSNDYEQIKTNPSSSIQKTNTKSSQSKHDHLNIHSRSPSRLRQEKLLYKKPQTPLLLTCSYRFNTEMMPSYMAETASTKARARSQSVPKERRSSTPEREGMAVSKRGLFIGSYEEFGSSSCRSSPMVKR